MAAGWGRGRALPHWAPLLILVLTVPGFSPSPTFGSPPDTLSAVAQGIPGSQIAAGGPLEDLIVELRVGRIARQTIIAALDLDHVLIPARPLFELLEIRSSIADDGSLRAVRQPDGTDLYVDGQLGLARVGDLALPHEQVIVRQAGGELYLWTELIASLLNVRVEVDLAELTVTIDPADELPVGRRVARERARAARHGGGSSAIADRVLAEDRTPFAGAVADWGVSLPDVGSMGASAYALRLGARVLGGGLDLRQLERSEPQRRRRRVALAPWPAWRSSRTAAGRGAPWRAHRACRARSRARRCTCPRARARPRPACPRAGGSRPRPRGPRVECDTDVEVAVADVADDPATDPEPLELRRATSIAAGSSESGTQVSVEQCLRPGQSCDHE